MPNKAGIVFAAMGAVLILSALLLFLYNGAEDQAAGQQSQEVLQEVQSIISQRQEDMINKKEEKHPTENQGTEPTESQETEPTESKETDPTESQETDPTEETKPPRPAEIPIVTIQGHEYIGFVTIPLLDIELPVMSDWDYDKLKIAPCRQFGSPLTDDLVIAAHNYKNHFGLLSDLNPGDEVIFTDMDGYEDRYALVRVETLQPTAVYEVQNSGHDLVLYTCTYGGATRIVAFFDRTE